MWAGRRCVRLAPHHQVRLAWGLKCRMRARSNANGQKTPSKSAQRRTNAARLMIAPSLGAQDRKSMWALRRRYAVARRHQVRSPCGLKWRNLALSNASTQKTASPSALRLTNAARLTIVLSLRVQDRKSKSTHRRCQSVARRDQVGLPCGLNLRNLALLNARAKKTPSQSPRVCTNAARLTIIPSPACSFSRSVCHWPPPFVRCHTGFLPA